MKYRFLVPRDQRWPRIRSAGVGSGRILRFFRTRSQNFEKSRNRSHFLFSAAAGVWVAFINVIAGSCKHCWIWVASMVARVWTGVAFSKFEKFSDPDSQLLEQERSLKMRLRPALPGNIGSKCHPTHASGFCWFQCCWWRCEYATTQETGFTAWECLFQSRFVTLCFCY